MENEKKAWQTPELQEMAVVVLSLHQKWWQKMAAGEKVLELRKSKPQCKAPFRVLVYVTGGVGVVGEFVCPEVLEIKNFEEAEKKSRVPAVKRKAIPKAVRQQVYDSLNGHCGYCGCEIIYKEMQVDHIEAVYLHEAELNAGEAQQVNSIENYMPACRMCNFYKSTMSIESFRKQLETLPERLEKLFIYRLAKKYGIVQEIKKPVQFYFEKQKGGTGNA